MTCEYVFSKEINLPCFLKIVTLVAFSCWKIAMLKEVDNEFMKYLATIRVKFPLKRGLNGRIGSYKKFNLERHGVVESGFPL